MNTRRSRRARRTTAGAKAVQRLPRRRGWRAASDANGRVPPRATPRKSEWTLQLRVWLERDGRAVLGRGRALLLEAIDRTNSISAAARELGMSYRRAWELVRETNEAAGVPFVAAVAGGHRGGGSRLTAAGREGVREFQALERHLLALSDQASAFWRMPKKGRGPQRSHT